MAISADQQQRVTNIMKKIVASMQIIFDENLRQVLLFGSYARGDLEEYSDMDVMVLVNLTYLPFYRNVRAEGIEYYAS